MSEVQESQELKELKTKLLETVKKYQRDHDWCDEPFSILEAELNLREPGQIQHDIFPEGTILAVDNTTYYAFKHFGRRWEYGGAGASLKHYERSYAEMINFMQDHTGSLLRVLRYGATHGNRHEGARVDTETNTLVDP